MADYYGVVDIILKNSSNEFMKKFSNLKSNRERYAMVSSVDGISSLLRKQIVSIDVSMYKKSNEVAKMSRNKGNELFRAGKLTEALKNYNECIMAAEAQWNHERSLSVDDAIDMSRLLNESKSVGESAGTELSLALANRSAVMLKLSRFQECIDDAMDSIECGYPRSQTYKLLERISVCHEHLGRYSEARECFDLAERSLEYSDLTEVEREAQKKLILVGIIRCQDGTGNSQLTKSDPGKSDAKDAKQCRPSSSVDCVMDNRKKMELLRLENPLPQVSRDAIRFVYSSDVGTHAKSSRKIRTGEVVMKDETFAKVLCPSYISERCYYCFIGLSLRSDRLFPCPSCTCVMYCSKKCASFSRYFHRHDLECPLIGKWLHSRTGPLAWLVVRILTSVGIDNWKKIIEPLNMIDSMRVIDQQQMRSDLNKEDLTLSTGRHGEDDKGSLEDALRREMTGTASLMYNLLSHSDKRNPQELLQYSILAVWILLLLKEGGILNSDDKTTSKDRNQTNGSSTKNNNQETRSKEISSTETTDIIGGIALKLLQIISCNGIEMTKMVPHKSLSKCEPRGYGLALYPKASLFNHSCDPDLELLFVNDLLVARCLKPVPAESPVNIDYGYLFYSTSREKRQDDLKKQYFFTCSCLPCTANWPVKKDLEKDDGCFLPQNAIKEGEKSELLSSCPVCGHEHSMSFVQKMGESITAEEAQTNQGARVFSENPKRRKKKKRKQINDNGESTIDLLNPIEPPQRNVVKISVEQNSGLLECFACGVRADEPSIERLRSMNVKLDTVLRKASHMNITSNTIKCLELYLDCRYYSPPKRVTQEMVCCISTLKQCYRLLGNE